MMGQVFNVLIIVAAGVMLADLVANPKGTGTIINGVTSLWSTSVNGMLGK
jgi:hypothetical protein